ncbi:MAG: hypothetical protein ABIJ59_03430 [Pseudomonadota bacterium]
MSCKTRIIKHNTAICNLQLNSETNARHYLINFKEHISSAKKQSFAYRSIPNKSESIFQLVLEKRPFKRDVYIKELDEEQKLLRFYKTLVDYDPTEDTFQMNEPQKCIKNPPKYTFDNINNKIFHKKDKRYSVINLKKEPDSEAIYKFTNIIDLAEYCYVNEFSGIDMEYWEFFSYVAFRLGLKAKSLLMEYSSIGRGKKLDHIRKIQALLTDAEVLLDYSKGMKYDPEINCGEESAAQKAQRSEWFEKKNDISRSLLKSEPIRKMVIAFSKRIFKRRRHMSIADVSYLIKAPALTIGAQNGIKLSTHDYTWTIEKWISSVVENPFQHISFLIFKEES